MRRSRGSCVLLVLLLAIFWQAVALVRPGWERDEPAHPGHAALHWLGAGHHHQDDGSIQLDDSRDSKLHMFGDHLTTAALPLPTNSRHCLVTGSTRPCEQLGVRLSEPILDGLLRPPRDAA